MIALSHFHMLSPNLWEIPREYSNSMRVPARIYASQKMLEAILNEKAVEQLINMTTLPGIEKYALAMPDIHQGYGFPIGGVAAFRLSDGIISPGGVGYDINCGVRLLASKLTRAEIQTRLEDLITQIYYAVPSGIGSSGPLILKPKELDAVLNTGVNWALNQGYALADDSEFIEENGCFRSADARLVSVTAKERGRDQLGTLGSGNHFLEIQEVVQIYDAAIAKKFGLFPKQVTVMIHTGSRGLGHQVCTDYVKLMHQKNREFKINLVDRELACAPWQSKEGQAYWQAMAAAANYAWVNRQIITDNIRNSWIKILGGNKADLTLVYDVAHNIAKQEKHGDQKLLVHRKGATRAFSPQHAEIPLAYQTTGQPVLIPGSMGTYSYVLAGTQEAMQNSFGSACHGAGRSMSRIKSKKTFDFNTLQKYLAAYGTIVRSGSISGLLEEAPKAYKDIEMVVDVVCAEKIAQKVAQLKPIAVIKG